MNTEDSRPTHAPGLLPNGGSGGPSGGSGKKSTLIAADEKRKSYPSKEHLEEKVGELIGCLQHANHKLLLAKDLYQATLACIAEAVITTDKDARVTYLNPVAETLSGWSNSDAAGLHVTVVLRTLTESSREPAEDAVTKCLETGKCTHLPGDKVLLRRDGAELSIDDTAAPITNTAGETVGAVLVFRDVTDTRRLVRQLNHAAFQDALTGLENRRGFERSLKEFLVSPGAKRPGALLYLDMDQFKVVNDTGGHTAGDVLLRQLGSLMRSHVRSADRVARLGGDEFGILLNGYTKREAERVANQLREAIAAFRFAWESGTFTISVSIGVVPIPQAGGSLSSLLIAADDACYAAKERGANRVQVYEADDRTLIERRGEMKWVGRINDALRHDHFCLYYQPIISLEEAAQSQPWGEILLRLVDEEGRHVPPGNFIPAAERYGLMTSIDRWVFEQSLAAIDLAGTSSVSQVYSINISGQSLSDETFLSFLIEELRRSTVNPSQICLEITETAAIGNLAHAIRFISTLKAQGCLFALDDFGTGFCSFAYLKSLAIDYIKIAGRFVHNMSIDPFDRAMVEGMRHVSRAMGIKTVAEHVEDHATLATLKSLGLEYGQGNVLGPARMLHST